MCRFNIIIYYLITEAFVSILRRGTILFLNKNCGMFFQWELAWAVFFLKKMLSRRKVHKEALTDLFLYVTEFLLREKKVVLEIMVYCSHSPFYCFYEILTFLGREKFVLEWLLFLSPLVDSEDNINIFW